MFYSQCPKCKSHAVNRMRITPAGALRQFCVACDTNLTLVAIRKARQTRKSAFSRVKTRRPSKSINLAYALVFGLFLGVLTIPFMSTEVTYAKGVENLTPEQQYTVLEDIKTHAFDIRRQLEGHKRFETADEVRNYVLAEAKKAGVHVAKVDFIAQNESQYDPKAVGDTHLTCPKTGKPIRSRGVFQITDCWHPEVSDLQAFDVEFSTEWALAIISTSKSLCISQWSTCAKWYRI